MPARPDLSPAEILSPRKRPSLLVVGDLMLDRYVWGDVHRISPEAPIQVLRVLREEPRLGGAANVMNNVLALGAKAATCGVVGNDAAGRWIRQRILRLSGDARGILVDPSRPTIEKCRMIAHSQQILRVDRERTHPLSAEVEAQAIRFIRRELPRSDGVLLSDYGKGLLTKGIVREAIEGARRLGKLALVDPKGRDYLRYRRATAITPNRQEAQEGTGMPLDGRAGVESAARFLKRRLSLDAAFVTLGAEGIAWVDGRGRFDAVPAQARAVYDVTGAGDTVLSALGVSLAAGAGIPAAARIANAAAGIVVGKVGAATATRAEVLAALGGHEHHPKVLSARALAAALADERRRGRRIVFTNGCFDILHVGHARLLAEARAAGDVLVVGLNSDGSVRRMKGPERPFVRFPERAALLASLESVDYVTSFDEPTPERLIRRVRPDVLVKGEDWRSKGVVGQRFVESYGGRVKLVRLVPDRSTTGLVDRIRGGNREERA